MIKIERADYVGCAEEICETALWNVFVDTKSGEVIIIGRDKTVVINSNVADE